VINPPENPPYASPVETRQQPRKALWVEIRDSSNGERRIELYDAPIPRLHSERERFLNRDVPTIFPGAKLRTIAGGAGTFVCGELLITAHYGAIRDDAVLNPFEERLPEPVAEAVGQGELFAA
jgi:hypothetical protein